MKSVFLIVAALGLAHAGQAFGAVLNLADVEILPQEIGRFQVRVACAPSERGGPPSACRELHSVAPTLAFRLRDSPTGLDDADREALKTSPTPMTAVLGAPITKAEALAQLGGEICGRRIFETDTVDQYGGAWALAPYMYQVDGHWVHRWTVTPKFAGYAAAIVDGHPQVDVLRTREDLERRRGPIRNLLDQVFSKSPF